MLQIADSDKGLDPEAREFRAPQQTGCNLESTGQAPRRPRFHNHQQTKTLALR